MVWFGYVSVGLVRFCIIWCVTVDQICYHAKSGACSFKNITVMTILVLFDLVWFGLVCLYFGLV